MSVMVARRTGCYGCEGTFLKDYSRKGVREGRVLYPVEDNSADGYLTDIGLAPGFCRDYPCQKIDVLGGRSRYAAYAYPERFKRLRSGYPCLTDALLLLEPFNRCLRYRAIVSCDIIVEKAPLFKLFLYGYHFIAS